jgi:predicted PurR-regulated permease PerM
VAENLSTHTSDVGRTETSGSVHRSSLEDTARLFEGPLGIRSLSLTGLFVLACFYTLYFARDFFLPVMLAIVFMFLLTPLIRMLKSVRVPEALGSAIVIVTVAVCIGFLAFELSGPLTEWLEKAPEIGAKLQAKAQPLRKYFARVSNTSEQVEKLTTTAVAAKDEPQRVELKKPSLLDSLLTRTSKLVFSSLVVIVLLYFLLASGDLFLTKLVHVLPTLSDKKKAVQIAREIENNISTYLSTIAMINTGIGILSGLLFWAFGLPNPALWGAIAGLLNFIPTVGALSVAILITLVSIASFGSFTHAVMVPLSFLALTVATGTFVSPLVMGHRLTLNPVVIFLGLSFWGWLWGLPGALLAVPMLAMFKIFCDHIEPLAPIGEFLGH